MHDMIMCFMKPSFKIVKSTAPLAGVLLLYGHVKKCIGSQKIVSTSTSVVDKLNASS